MESRAGPKCAVVELTKPSWGLFLPTNPELEMPLTNLKDLTPEERRAARALAILRLKRNNRRSPEEQERLKLLELNRSQDTAAHQARFGRRR